MSFMALICTVYHMQSIATLIYYCASRLCHYISNSDGNLPLLESRCSTSPTFNDLDEEAPPVSL